MSTNIQKYQQNQFAKYHYRKLLQAKTTITQFNQAKKQTLNISKTITPIDKYEYLRTNDKIRNKLLDIYQESAERIKNQKKKRRKQSKSVNFTQKQQQRTIQDYNVKLYQKLITAKSTIGDFKARQKDCKRYSRITRKKSAPAQNNMYQAYKQILNQSRATTRKSSRSAYKRKSKGTTIVPQSARIGTSEIQIQDSI